MPLGPGNDDLNWKSSLSTELLSCLLLNLLQGNVTHCLDEHTPPRCHSLLVTEIFPFYLSDGAFPEALIYLAICMSD